MLHKLSIIARKELQSYFSSSLAHCLLFCSIAIFNAFFFLAIDGNKEATLRETFQIMEFMLILIIPLVTMRVFAEERSSGTLEFLMTTPTSNTAIVFGKFLGTAAFFTAMILMTVVYYGIIEYFGTPDYGAVITGYMGIWLEGLFFIAIGLWISSMVSNQTAAAMGSYAVLLFLYVCISLDPYMPPALKPLLQYVSVLKHSENFFAGILTLSDGVYFVSGIAYCLVLTRLNIENRIWR